MNVQMENINVTQRDGRVTHLDRVYIRGSHVRLFIVPDMLRCEEKCCRSHEYLLTIFLQERAHVQISRHSWSRCRSVASVALPDKRSKRLVSIATRKLSQSDMRLECAGIAVQNMPQRRERMRTTKILDRALAFNLNLSTWRKKRSAWRFLRDRRRPKD